MLAFQPSSLKNQVATLNAAPARPQRRSAPGFAPPLRPLAAIPAQPAVQRKCGDCAAEEREQLPVQPRLEVGPVGDRYEREADAIAGQVMAMRDAEVSDAAPSVQRTCSACASSKDEPKARRTALTEGEKDEDEPVRARHVSAEGGAETISASHGELTGGGAPLPSSSRGFFEARMGRDLSDVRVHQGGGADDLNRSIAARAFTYRNHIWLGGRESASPGFTMAHELAHVMQQTAPGPIGPPEGQVQRQGDEGAATAAQNRADRAAEQRAQDVSQGPMNMAGRSLTGGDIAVMTGAAPDAPPPVDTRSPVCDAQFVLHDTASPNPVPPNPDAKPMSKNRMDELDRYDRRSIGEGTAAYLPPTGPAVVAHDTFFGPQRPTTSQWEQVQDEMDLEDRRGNYRAIWRATKADVRAAALDDVLTLQESKGKEKEDERSKAVTQLEATKGKVESAAAWAADAICALVTPEALPTLAASEKSEPILKAACDAMAPIVAERKKRVESTVNVEIPKFEGSGCNIATRPIVKMPPYTSSQYDNIKNLYFRAAMEANVFPKIITHFELDKDIGDHCDPRCFDLTRLYQDIQVALHHPQGNTYGITPVYNPPGAGTVWWYKPVCGWGPPK